MNRKLIILFMAMALSVNVTGCAAQSANGATIQTTTQTTVAQTQATQAQEVSTAEVLSNINVSSGDSESVGQADTFITLGSTIAVEGNGATVENNKVKITAAGTYSIKGTIAEGQIIVDAGEDDKVYIILNGVNITCSNSAPIYIKNAKKAIISLAENTQNSVKDGETYVFEDAASDEPNAAIFSKSDLIIIGNGSLNVDANYNNGITSKDDLKIQSGNITVNAKADGLRGKDSVVITNGNITVTAGEDGIKSNNDEDDQKGYVLIEGGKITITAVEDGIQAETNVFVKAGDIAITTGGGSAKAAVKTETMGRPGMEQTTTTQTQEVSTKAVKAGVNIIIEGGTFNINSSDDAIHSNDNLVINNGTFSLASGDDAIHSEYTLTINGGTIDITKSYEGIESETITINDGNVKVVSSDDGINASSAEDSSGTTTQSTPSEASSQRDTSSMGEAPNVTAGQSDMPPMGEKPNKAGGFGEAVGNGVININGGYITVNAEGDGIDANGSIYMKGGTVIVNGPTNDGNGYLDYDATFEITGGTLIAAGSAGMAQAPSSTSTQNSIKINLTSQTANTLVRVESESGEEILTFAPIKQYSSIIVSSAKLITGSTYKVYVGGSSTGTVVDGIYSGSTYSKGTEVGSVTISSTVSQITQQGATASSGMGGKTGMRGQGGPGAMNRPMQ